MQKRLKPNEISARLIRYIDICTEAKSVIDRYFEKDDYFFLSDYGIDSVDLNLGDGLMFPSDPAFIGTKINISECVWLPTLEQIGEEMQIPRIEEIMNALRNIQSYCQRLSSDEWPPE
ncbi:hypothetical protein ACFLRX_04890 [Acidobacteriota bacterium]